MENKEDILNIDESISQNELEKLSQNELEKLSHRDKVRFALFCAYQVESGWKDIVECVKVIKTVELWLEGKATIEECSKATDAAYVCSGTSTGTVFYTGTAAISYNPVVAAYDSYTASVYAHAYNAIYTNITSAETTKAQWEYYYELLYFDENFEEIVLRGNNE